MVEHLEIVNAAVSLLVEAALLASGRPFPTYRSLRRAFSANSPPPTRWSDWSLTGTHGHHLCLSRAGGTVSWWRSSV